MTGELRDSYLAALQNDLVELGDDTFVVGVVRHPMYGLSSVVDENWPALAPTAELLSEYKHMLEEASEELALEAVGFSQRYDAHLSDKEPQERIEDLIERLEGGQDVCLICYENTDEKFCHRDLLSERIKQQAPHIDQSDEGQQTL